MKHNSATILGIGIVDVDGPVRNCQYYKRWNKIIRRCYDSKLHEAQPTYKGCTVAPEWHYFSNFKKWCMEQGDISNKQIDKDILYPGNKVYGPDTCIFVSRELNVLFTKANSSRGKYPIGVSYNIGRKKLEVRMKVHGKVKKNFGYYDSVQEAEQVYIKAKKEYIQKEFIEKETDERLIEGLNRWIEVLDSGKFGDY